MFQTTNQMNYLWIIYGLSIIWSQWEFQDPKLEVPTICKAYFSGLCQGDVAPISMAWNMVLTYLHFRILEFPLIDWFTDRSQEILNLHQSYDP